MKAVTGRFWPADSPVHRLDARPKMALAAGWVVVIMLTDRAPGFGILLLMVLAALRASSLPVVLLGAAAKPVWPFAVLTIALTALSLPGEAWVRLGSVTFTRAGVVLGLVYAGRMLLLVWGGAWLTWTTSPVHLASGLGQMLRPLRHLGVPAEDVALAVTLAIRFFPTLFDESARLGRSLRARGLRVDRGPVRRRIAVMGAMVIPLFVGALRRADAQALALEARGWRGRFAGPNRRVPAAQWALVTGVLALLFASLRLGR